MSADYSVWLITIEDRHGEHGVLGPYRTFARAQQELAAYVAKHYRGRDPFDSSYNDEFGSSFAVGCFYSEEEIIEIVERQVKD